jgi:cytochrome c oxidase subunit II
MLGRALAVAMLLLGALAAPAGAAGLGPDGGASGTADSIRTSYWVMLIVILAIGIPLLAGLLVAARRFRTDGAATPRRVTAGRGVIARVSGVFAVLAVAIFVFGIVMTRDARDADADASGEALDINVVGQQWLWRFEYPRDPEAQASPGIATVFSYGELVVPVDTTVNLNIDSTDVLHRWFIPELGGQVEAVPGEIAQTTFRADEEGVYEGQSTEFSGTGYPALRARVRVVSAEEYDQYVQDLADDIAEAQSAVQESVAAEESQ